MIMRDIRRTTFEVVEFREDVEALARSAEEILGYTALRRTREKVVEGLGVLRAALAELAVEVLVDADVLQYQRERLIEATSAAHGAFVAALATGGDIRPFTTFHGPRWNETPINDYADPIPLDVVEKLVRIKEAVPTAHISVVHLDETPDPFARVWLGTSSYSPTEAFWVAVWDEPRFEAGRYRNGGGAKGENQ